MSERRVRILIVSTCLIPQLLSESRSYEVIENPMPPDARIVDARFDGFNGRVAFVIESVSFDPVPEGHPIPEITPILRTIDAPVTEPSAN